MGEPAVTTASEQAAEVLSELELSLEPHLLALPWRTVDPKTFAVALPDVPVGIAARTIETTDGDIVAVLNAAHRDVFGHDVAAAMIEKHNRDLA